ncbi:uncharacterized protein [Spinacia oleracea]|uniref:Endonuclease/exonuclease/phosphatase domain-containing protein n=1 Tax=Spinacia oleracea TaxID=3562 RepID=A0ABM3RSK8_SPIOL|nr:uncharacterized protein LOC130472160 [Spinacia oleracea]
MEMLLLPVRSGIMDFEMCTQSNKLFQVHTVGAYYTWCNNQYGSNRIVSRMDRCLANQLWLDKFHMVTAEVLDMNVSDHCPILINFENSQVQRHTLFKFLNVFTEVNEFYELVDAQWRIQQHKHPLLDIWFKLKHLKPDLSLIISMISEEKSDLENLEKWSLIEEKIWQQKSRVDWIQLGDSNTKYFHAFIKERRSMNAIKVLLKDDGSRVCLQGSIKEEIVDFYRKLMGTAAQSIPMVDITIVEKGPLL